LPDSPRKTCPKASIVSLPKRKLPGSKCISSQGRFGQMFLRLWM